MRMAVKPMGVRAAVNYLPEKAVGVDGTVVLFDLDPAP